MAAQPDNIMMLMMMVMPVATQVCMPVLQLETFNIDTVNKDVMVIMRKL